MSMSLFVVLALNAEPNAEELNQYSKQYGHNIEYAHQGPLSEVSGFLPAKLNGMDAGVEVYSFPVSDFPPPLKAKTGGDFENGIVFQLRFGANPIEAQTAFTTAIILNTKYKGITIEDQAGSIMSVEQLQEASSYFGDL